MAFENFFVHTATVSRLVLNSTGIRSNYTEVESSLSCLIEPVTAEFASITDMVYGRTYNAYFRLPADIQIGDRIITEQSTGGGNDQ
jgi:argonaute-like protein implicated in RNA metabolism and viral defense